MCDNKNTEIVEQGDTGNLLKMVVERLGSGNDESMVTAIKDLVALKNQQDDRFAEQEFNKALAEFQEECPPIKKTGTTKEARGDGGGFSFAWAKLDVIAETVRPYLFHRGLSFTWDSKTVDKDIEMTCHLRHRNGHEITASATAPIPDKIMQMNKVQIPSAVRTYLERQTLIQVLGLTTTDEDTDAVSSEPIDEKDAIKLEERVEAVGDKTKFLKLFNVDDFTKIRKVDYKRALSIVKNQETKKAGQL